MDSFKALSILAFCASVHAAALPQILPVGVATGTTATVGPAAASGAAGVNLGRPVLPGTPALYSPGLGAPALPVPPPTVPAVGFAPKLPLPDIPLPAADGLPVPNLSLPKIPSPPSVGGLAVPVVPLPDTKASPLPVPLPKTPNLDDADALDKVVKLGSEVLEIILDILDKGKTLIPNGGSRSSILLRKRQLGGLAGSLPLPVPQPSPGAALGAVTGSNPASGVAGAITGANPVSGVTGGVTGSNPVAGVAGGITGSNPVSGVAGGITGSNPVSGVAGGITGSNPVSGVAGTVANTAGNVPIAGSAAAGVANTAAGATGSLSEATGGATGAASGAANTAPNAPGSIPGPWPISNGIPGSDPLGAFSISVVATLLSLLKKDPMSLFAPSLRAPVKRDLPELAKRQIQTLPSLSSGISGVGIGGLPLSGVPGVPPDLAFLVSSIAKNIAVPGGNGIGSITSNILGVLNGVVPNFLFQLPVMQDAVPTFGVLQLLSSINPTKFGSLATLNNLASLQQAVGTIPAADLAFIKTLPPPSDPTNLIARILTLADNILSLPGNVANLRASVSVLCFRSLGLAVPGV